MAVTVDYASSNGTATTADSDYTAASGTLTIPVGSTTGTINVLLNRDAKYEVNETLTMTLSNGSGYNPIGSTLSATGTINNDDTAPTISIANVTQNEGTGAGTTSYTFTVTASAVSGIAISVDYATSDGTALVANSDYTAASGTATIAVGATTTTFSVLVNQDALNEGNDTFNVTLSGGAGYTGAGSTLTAVGTLTNDDAAPTISIANVSNNEGNAGTVTYTFTITLSGVNGIATTVNYATSDGVATIANSDYIATSGTATIAAGSTTTTFTVTGVSDGVYEIDETFNVTLSGGAGYATSGSTLTATGTLTNDDALPTISIANVSVTEGSGAGTTNMTFTITQSVATGAATTVNYATTSGTGVSGTDFTAASATATIAAGATTTTFSIVITRDTLDEVDETLNITLSGGSNYNSVGSTLTAVGTITDDDAPPTISLAFTAPSYGEASGTGSFTATLSAASGKTINIDFTTSDGTATAGSDYTTSSTTAAVIAAGATTISFTFPITDDTTTCEFPESVVGTISNLVNVTAGTLTASTFIHDNDHPVITLAATNVNEGSSVTITPTASFSCLTDLVINYSTIAGTAIEGQDFPMQTGTVTIPATTTTASSSFTITTTDDLIPENPEWFSVTASLANANVTPALIKIDDGDAGTAVTKVSTGLYNSCAINNLGQVKCWGTNREGTILDIRNRVGDEANEMGANLFSVNLGTGREPKLVASANDHTCAILDNNQLKCWGLNSSAQLGYGNTSIYGDSYLQMGDALPAVSLPGTTHAVEVCGGSASSCARLNNGNIVCWGNGALGQLGNGNLTIVGDAPAEMGNGLVPVLLGGKIASKLSCGGDHYCAVVDDAGVNVIKCWGAGANGRLGNEAVTNLGITAGVEIPNVNLGTNVVALDVAAGNAHTCAQLLDTTDNKKKVKCWGANSVGQLGYDSTATLGDGAGEMGDALPFINFGLALDITKLAAGYAQNCVEFTAGKIRCWGQGTQNAMSTANRGDNAGEMIALVDVSFGAGLTIVDWTTTDQGGCAIVQDASLNKTYRCWGSNVWGYLGVGDTTARLSTAAVAVNIGAGNTPLTPSKPGSYAHANCLIVDNGATDELKCWGLNQYSQLGQGKNVVGDSSGDMGANLSTINLGTYLATPLVAQEIAVHNTHMCILATAGVMKCLGANANGQFGLGTTSTNPYGEDPGETWANQTVLTTTRPIIKISVHQTNTCALFDDFTLHCWGNNTSKLGQGNSSQYTVVPPAINFGNNRKVLNFSWGQYVLCALLDDLTVKCFGQQTNGNLGGGQGNTSTRGSSPTEIGDFAPILNFGADKVKYIEASRGNSAFSSHACAIMTNGNVRCWGYNGAGGLGYDNTTAITNTTSSGVVNLGKPAVKLFLGSSHSCAIFNDGSAKCWGSNANGELGVGSVISKGASGTPPNNMASLSTLSVGAGVSVLDGSATSWTNSTGGYTCIVLSNNKLKCFGYNTYGNLGTGDLKNWGALAGETPDAIPDVNLGW